MSKSSWQRVYDLRVHFTRVDMDIYFNKLYSHYRVYGAPLPPPELTQLRNQNQFALETEFIHQKEEMQQ